MTRIFSGIECQSAGAESAELIAALHRMSFTSDTGERWRQQDIADILAFHGTRSWVASRAGRPLGYLIARMVLDETEILSIGVRTDARHRGAGSALMRVCLEAAAAQGMRTIHLEVRNDNHPAQELYGKFGFQQVGLRQGYYRSSQGAAHDAITMMRYVEDTSKTDKIAAGYT